MDSVIERICKFRLEIQQLERLFFLDTRFSQLAWTIQVPDFNQSLLVATYSTNEYFKSWFHMRQLITALIRYRDNYRVLNIGTLFRVPTVDEHVDKLKIVAEFYNYTGNYSLLQQYILWDQFDSLAWLLTAGGICKEDIDRLILLTAVEQKSPTAFAIIADHFQLSKYDVIKNKVCLRRAITSDNLTMVKWIVNQFDLDRSDIFAIGDILYLAIEHLPILRWLAANVGFTRKDFTEDRRIMPNILYNYRIKTLIWLVEEYGIDKYDACLYNENLVNSANWKKWEMLMFCVEYFSLTRHNFEPKKLAVFLYNVTNCKRYNLFYWLADRFELKTSDFVQEFNNILYTAICRDDPKLLNCLVTGFGISEVEFKQTYPTKMDLQSGLRYSSSHTKKWLEKTFNIANLYN